MAGRLSGTIGAADCGRANESDQRSYRADRGASDLAAVDHTGR
jgi:hypothetical protein